MSSLRKWAGELFASRYVTSFTTRLSLFMTVALISGSGPFSVVRRGVCKKTGLQVVVKTCDKKLDLR